MWICARCGTEAQRPEICSACGSAMKPFDQPATPKEDRYQFVLIAFLTKGGTEAIGPFPNVTAADQWWDANAAGRGRYGYKDYEVSLMEAPSDDSTRA